jgi:hypothetical protein
MPGRGPPSTRCFHYDGETSRRQDERLGTAAGGGALERGPPLTSAAAISAATWAARAPQLAEWAWARLVNRRDAWGRYGSNGTYTAPAVALRGQVLLAEAHVARHFRGRCRGDILGLHTTSLENLSRWGLVDADYHGEGGADPGANLRASLAWYDKARWHGFRPLLTSSNGAGGYHLRLILSEPAPTPRVFALMRWLVSDHADHGLGAPPETFPKQPRIKPGRYGNWARLPGRHHSRPHWSTVWDGARWLERAEAVAFILALKGDPPSLIPAEAAELAPRRPAGGGRPRGAGPAPNGGPVARILAYLARLPHLGEGQGRDRVAFNFACFLVRDLGLPDEKALPWLDRWDAGNTPPKGEARLREILKNAHEYGQHAYGAGLSGAHGHGRFRFTVEI